ncbi:MAG: host specificity protein, partial [Paracoccus sp. (in: a-proteobacteria)]|nr:host specificity protein [Paracoccus sp. (in: a-proteobacteria)]
ERAGAVTLDKVRLEPPVNRPADATEDMGTVARFAPPVPVWPVFLDLPLMRGDEVAHAPHLAVTATPWSGAAAVWSSDRAEGGFALNRTLPERAVMGVTESPLYAARAGAVDRGAPLRLRLKGGALASASWDEVLAGANLIAVGDGSPEGWELIQFAQAVPVSPGLWEIGERLRGQAGTDALMPEVWPKGSVVVVLDGAPKQVDLPPSARGLVRHWRIGPAARPPEDGSYSEIALAFRGAGLRPYAPCHLRVDAHGRATWVRRTRIGGDGWDGADVPLGEDREQYHLRLMRGGDLLFEAITGVSHFEVPATAWAKARAGGAFRVEVAQLSDAFGAGLYTKCNIEGSNPDE